MPFGIVSIATVVLLGFFCFYVSPEHIFLSHIITLFLNQTYNFMLDFLLFYTVIQFAVSSISAAVYLLAEAKSR